MKTIPYWIGWALMMVGLTLAARATSEEGAQGESAAKPFYQIQRASVTPALDGQWNGPAWKGVPALEIGHFYRTDLSDHRPKTQSKVVYDEKGIYVHFRVEDQYVRSVETKYHGKVWEDACVEFFVEPKPGRGYFNFETNCGGTMLLSYHENPEWKGDSLRESGDVPSALAEKVKIYHSMPKVVDPEVEEPTIWHVEYFIPFEVLETYVGDLEGAKGQTWRANFYKCAENNSHPHWASWSLIETKLDFHQPEFFSEIRFQK